jgi:hypothetical protein
MYEVNDVGQRTKVAPTLSQQNSRQHAKLGMLKRPQAKPAEAALPFRAVINLPGEFVGRHPTRDLAAAVYETVKATLVLL